MYMIPLVVDLHVGTSQYTQVHVPVHLQELPTGGTQLYRQLRILLSSQGQIYYQIQLEYRYMYVQYGTGRVLQYIYQQIQIYSCSYQLVGSYRSTGTIYVPVQLYRYYRYLRYGQQYSARDPYYRQYIVLLASTIDSTSYICSQLGSLQTSYSCTSSMYLPVCTYQLASQVLYSMCAQSQQIRRMLFG